MLLVNLYFIWPCVAVGVHRIEEHFQHEELVSISPVFCFDVDYPVVIVSVQLAPRHRKHVVFMQEIQVVYYLLNVKLLIVCHVVCRLAHRRGDLN